MQERENYCLLIGLNPNQESTLSPESINTKIQSKEKKWNKEFNDRQNDLDRRFAVNEILHLVPDMKAVMKDPVRRSKEFEAGRKLLKVKASKLHRNCIVLRDGSYSLLPGAAEDLLKKIKWEGLSKDDLVKTAGITSVTVKSPVSVKVVNAYKGIREVGAFTPVEVLNTLIENKDLNINASPLRESSSMLDIRSAFDNCEKRITKIVQDVLPTQDSYIQALRTIKTVLDDDAEFSMLMKYGRCMRAVQPIMNSMDEDYGQPFSREYFDNLLGVHMKGNMSDISMAMSILEEYCVKKKYLANFSNRDSKYIYCPGCGGITESGAGIMCCSICGFGIRTKCPRCENEQSSTNQSCVKCGFDFQSSLKKADELVTKFKSDLDNGLVTMACQDLDALKSVYSTHPEVKNLENKLKTANARYGAAILNINSSYGMRKFKSCEMYCDRAKSDFPYIMENDVEVRTKYNDCQQRIRDADELCLKAEKTEDVSEKMNLYVTAADRCPDHPVTVSNLSQYPPESPADATFQIRDEKVLIKFAVPEERKNMTFCIYRSPDRLPIVNEDTIPLTEIQNSVHLDKSLDPGIDYFYSVYSKRYGILSKEYTCFGPVTICSEVDNVMLEPIAGGVKVSYKKPKGCTNVRIWRKEGSSLAGNGDEIEINHNGETTFEDLGLKGGVRYNYLFACEYAHNDRVDRSMGLALAVNTIRFPEPIRDMEVRWNKSDGSFTARWKSKEDVTLYSTPKKVTMYGRMVEMKDVKSWMTEILPIETYDNGMTFMLPDGAVQFIYPMINCGKVAVKGKEILVANLKPFRDVEAKICGGDCDITVGWPAGADSAVLAIKANDTVTDPNDITAEKITVSYEAYERDKMIRIPMGNSKKKIVTIFSQYDIDGEKLYAKGTSLTIFSGNYNKVYYTLKPEGGKSGRVILNISTEESIKSLPPMCATAVSEGIPLKINDGENIWTQREPLMLNNGKASVVLQYNMDLKKVRLFFLDEDDCNLFKFIHPIFRER